MTVLFRLLDRVRPWSGGASDSASGGASGRLPGVTSNRSLVAVIGAGPAGLATAALLARRGLAPVVFDRADRVGGSWPQRYDSLRLNTVRWMSDLPGKRMPRRFGRWVGRDDLVAYLDDYARHHRLDVRLGVEVDRVERLEDRHASPAWSVVVGGEPRAAAAVVVATGHSTHSKIPAWSGATSFTGRLLHAADYRRPDDFAGAKVVVVGAGSSGGEIAVDLARAGIPVDWSVRTAPRVFPREVAGVPATPLAPIGDALPERWIDALAPRLERRIYGPRDYLPEPTTSMMRLLERCKEPLTADGIVRLVRDGSVRVVDALDRFDGDDVVLTDGSRLQPDAVIAATGYRPGLEHLVGHLGVLDPDGRPTSSMPLDGLGFVGFRIPLTGTLWAMESDARHVARSLRA